MESVREAYGKCKGVIHECKGGFLVLYGRSTVLIQKCTGDTPITYSAICYYYIKVLGTGLWTLGNVCTIVLILLHSYKKCMCNNGFDGKG